MGVIGALRQPNIWNQSTNVLDKRVDRISEWITLYAFYALKPPQTSQLK
jgi:hypothetical protein